MITAQEDPRTSVRGSSPSLRLHRLHPGVRPWGAFTIALFLLSLLTFRTIVLDPGGRVFAENDDTSLFIWWFANGADAVASTLGFGSGREGFLYTTHMNWPVGVNGAWNTSVLGLAIPFAPLTWLWGPVVAYNTAIVLSPVAAGLAAALFFTRFADRLPAFAAATLYGFSPYLIAQAGGHLNLSFAVLPPLVGAFLWKATTASAGGDLRERLLTLVPWGILLGGAIGWQFYVSTELLAGTFLAALVAVLVLVAVLRGRLRGRLLPAAAASGAAVVMALLLAAPLLSTMAVADNSPSGPIRPHGVWNNDLADLVIPGAAAPLSNVLPEIPRVMHIDAAEIGGYVSPLWLLLAVWVAVRFWRSRRHGGLVQVLSGVAILVWLLSMGSPLRVWGAEIPVPGPFRLVEQMPVLENILPMRLSVHVVLCLSGLTAVLLHHVGRSGRMLTAPTAVLAGVVLLIMPVGVVHRDITIPYFFADGAVKQVLPDGAVVKAVPAPRAVAEADYAQAMVWQAVSGMHYEETGGYFVGGTDNYDVIYQSLLDPLDQLLRDEEQTSAEDIDPQAIDEAIGGVRAGGTEFVLIPQSAPLLHWQAKDLAAALATAPGVEAELVVDVWVVDLTGHGAA